MSESELNTSNGETPAVNEQSSEKRIGCAHYKRRAKFVVGVILFYTFHKYFNDTQDCRSLPGSKHSRLYLNPSTQKPRKSK